MVAHHSCGISKRVIKIIASCSMLLQASRSGRALNALALRQAASRTASMANQYRTLTRDIASSLRSQNVDAAAAGVALDAFARALPDGKLRASLGEPGSEQRAAVSRRPSKRTSPRKMMDDDLGADDDTLSALASIAAEAAFAKDAVALGKCCRDAAQTLGDAEIPLLDRSDGDGVAAAAKACVAALCASVQLLEDDVGDESDWRAGALAGCYAALLAQTSGRCRRGPRRPRPARI